MTVRNTFGRRMLPFLLIAALGVGVGCGGDDEEPAGGGAATSAESAATADGANADIEKLTTRPTSIGIDEKIEGEIPKDQTIAFLQCAFPDCAQIGDVLEEAAKSVGWKVDRINAGATPETIKASWQEALRRNPDAIVQTGSPRKQFFQDELDQAIAKKIKLIGIAERESKGPWLVSLGSGEGWARKAADNVAKYVAAEYDSGKVLMVNVVGSGILEEASKTFTEKLPEYCADCSVEQLDIPVTAFGKDAPKRIASKLQANPDYKFVYLSTIDFVVGLSAAYAGAGVTPPPTAGNSSTPAGLDALAKGDAGLAVTAAYCSLECPYRAIDALIRDANGQDVSVDTDETLPNWLVTKDKVPSERPLPMVADYQQQFKKLWGVG